MGTDAELFLEEAAIDEVDSVMSSCVESGDKLANGYDATTALGACETKAKIAFKAFRGGEEAAIDAEITALDTKIAGMAEGAAKEVEKATKATKEQKKKLKAREIEYTYTKSKQDAGRKNALAGVKAKMEDAKSKNKDIDAEITALDTEIAGMDAGTAKDATKAAKKIDMNTPAYKDEKRAMAKKAFKASMAVADILPVEMEKLLKETSKKEASDQLDAAFEIAQSATTDADIRTAFPGAGAKIDAYKTALDTANTKLDTDIAAAQAAGKADEVTKFQTEKNANLAKKTTVPAAELKKIKWKCVQDTAKAAAKDARMPKKGSVEDVRETNIAADIAAIAALDTEIEGLTGEDKIAKVAEKATKEAEKLTKETERDVSFKKMMNEIAREKASVTMAAAMRAKPDMTDSKIKDFIKKGAVKKVREVAKTVKGATKKETRDSVQAAMKESLGKPDKLVGGVYVSQVTETDAELFLEEAAIDEVDSVMSSCVESGDKLANGYDATTALGACETKAKIAFKAFRGGEEAAIDAEITALNTAIASASGADKIAKEAEKATKEQKKKLKAREIEYTYTKSKQDAGRKNALAGVKAKMEDAKSK